MTTHRYNAARRLETITYDDGTTAIFAYDERGNRTLAENADSRREMTYDTLGRLETVLDVETGRTIRYSHDEVGNRASMTVEPDGLETSYAWDARGQLTRLTDPDGGEYRFAHDAAGRRILATYPNGMTLAQTYSAASEILAMVYSRPSGEVLESFRYQYDASGNRTEKVFADGSAERYGYDDLSRLTSASYGTGRAVDYLYDPVGNRLEMTETPPAGAPVCPGDVRPQISAECSAQAMRAAGIQGPMRLPRTRTRPIGDAPGAVGAATGGPRGRLSTSTEVRYPKRYQCSRPSK